MNVLTTLLSQYSVETIIITVVMLMLSVKFLGELFEWCYQKLRYYFNVKDAQQERHEEIMGKLDNAENMMVNLEKETSNHGKRIEALEAALEKQCQQQEFITHTLDTQICSFTNLEEKIGNLSDQMQDTTRTFIMEKYDKYVNDIGAIDIASLQDIERRFVCYKSAGGDTFVDGLMKKIRELPMITVEQVKEDQISNLKSKIGGC